MIKNYQYDHLFLERWFFLKHFEGVGRWLWTMQIEGMEVSLLTVTEVSGTISGIAKGKEIQVISEVRSLGERKRSTVGPKILSLIRGSFHCTVLCFLSRSRLTLCDPMVCSPPGSSVHGVLQARILVWIAMPSFRGSSKLRDWIQVFYIAGRFFTSWATREVRLISVVIANWSCSS